MKKNGLLSALLMMFGLTATAQESISVGEVLVPQGRQGMMKVKFQFNENHDYVSYQFKVNLPEGISFVLDDYDQPTVVLGDGQPASLFNLSLHPTGHFVTCYSNPSTPIASTAGVLVRIPVVADESLAVGTELNGTLTSVECSHSDAVAAPFGNVSFTVRITDEIILDENSPTEPAATGGEVWSVRVKRTVKAGEWSTLCLPFDLTAAEFKGIFGDDAVLAYFTGYDAEKEGTDVTGLTINFEEDNLSEGFTANYPYLIKTSRDITEFNVNTTIDPDDVLEVYKSGRKVVGQFVGTYQAGTVVPENSLILNDNKFCYSDGLTTMKAFRAYFTLNDVLAETDEANVRVLISIDGVTTAIQPMTKETDADGWFTIGGMKLDREPAQAGVYIHRGEKKVKK